MNKLSQINIWFERELDSKKGNLINEHIVTTNSLIYSLSPLDGVGFQNTFFQGRMVLKIWATKVLAIRDMGR